jgi:hypothetical protein
MMPVLACPLWFYQIFLKREAFIPKCKMLLLSGKHRVYKNQTWQYELVKRDRSKYMNFRVTAWLNVEKCECESESEIEMGLTNINDFKSRVCG